MLPKNNEVMLMKISENCYKLENTANPISPNVFCADPTGVEYNGRLYIYGRRYNPREYSASGRGYCLPACPATSKSLLYLIWHSSFAPVYSTPKTFSLSIPLRKSSIRAIISLDTVDSTRERAESGKEEEFYATAVIGASPRHAGARHRPLYHPHG